MVRPGRKIVPAGFVPKAAAISHLRGYKKAHAGRPALIIGNGPSADLLEKYKSHLPKILSFGVNRSFPAYHTPYWLGLDREYVIHIQTQRNPTVAFVWDHFHSVCREKNKFVKIAWFNNTRGLLARSLSPKDGIAFGNSSTYSALHLAAMMGCTPIYIIGNDLAWIPGSKSHFYKNKFSEVGSKKYVLNGITYLTKGTMLRMKRNFEASKPLFDKNGIKIINISGGILEKYKRKTVDEAMEKLIAFGPVIPFKPKPGGKVKPWESYIQRLP